MWEQYLFYNLDCFWHIDQTHHERVSTKARETSRTCCGFTVVSAALLPDRIRSRPTAHRTHRQLKCSAAPAHPHCLRRSYHARTVAECKYPFPTFIAPSRLRCVKPKMLPLGFRVIAHLRAGTAHRPTIGNNVTPDPIFNCQVTVLFYLFISGHPFVVFMCNISYNISYYAILRRMSSVTN
ncbi:hypothetical protein SAMN02910280_1370 [Ruminococcus flavefaciens]|uniref:Uncharacterized protein n=1 Tax=Ruminococcus flavefaciens TaxID=1265 RepID=A0A1K1MNJ8_RUMFL|nr:hypothetical protein SAMN02910280_1370 [Ruminococcus flavefaciens]